MDVHRFERRAMGSPLRLTVVDPASARSSDDPARTASPRTRLGARLGRVRGRRAGDVPVPRDERPAAVNRAAGSGRPIAVDRRLVRALVASDRAGRMTGWPVRCPGPDRPRAARLPGRGPRRRRATDGATGMRRPPDRPDAETGTIRHALDVRRIRAAARSRSTSRSTLGGIGKGLGPALGVAGPRAGRPPRRRGGRPARGGRRPGGLRAVAGPRSVARRGGGPARPPGAPGGDRRWSAGRSRPHPSPIHRWATADGRTVHHLIDPRTGEPGGDGLLAVTVAGPDPAWSEVWSKSLFLAGARAIADARPGPRPGRLVGARGRRRSR